MQPRDGLLVHTPGDAAANPGQRRDDTANALLRNFCDENCGDDLCEPSTTARRATFSLNLDTPTAWLVNSPQSRLKNHAQGHATSIRSRKPQEALLGEIPSASTVGDSDFTDPSPKVLNLESSLGRSCGNPAPGQHRTISGAQRTFCVVRLKVLCISNRALVFLRRLPQLLASLSVSYDIGGAAKKSCISNRALVLGVSSRFPRSAVGIVRGWRFCVFDRLSLGRWRISCQRLCKL